MSTIPQTTSKTIEYINLKENETNEKEPTKYEPTENTPTEIAPIKNEPIGDEPIKNHGNSPTRSPRSSPRTINPMHSPSIDPAQQEIYDYMESLEWKETTRKETIQSCGEGRN